MAMYLRVETKSQNVFLVRFYSSFETENTVQVRLKQKLLKRPC